MSIPNFVPPSWESVLKRRVQIPFNGAVGANAQLTLLSSRITFKYAVVATEVVFRDDAANNLQVYVLVSNNQNTSTTNVPPDPNVFSQYSPSPYFVGEGTIKRAECSVEAPVGYEFIKVHAVNNNAYAQTINATITLQEI